MNNAKSISLQDIVEAAPVPIDISKSKLRKKKKRVLDNDLQDLNYSHSSKVFGIDNWINIKPFLKFDSRSVGEWAKSAVAEYWDLNPNHIFIPPVNVISAIKSLKSLGQLSGIFSSIYYGDKPNSLFALFKNENSEFFIFTEDIKYAKNHPFLATQKEEDLINYSLCFSGISIFCKPDDVASYEIFSKIYNDNKVIMEQDSCIDMIVATQHGMALRSINLDPPEKIDLSLHYGEGFVSYHEKLLSRIEDRDKGIVMLHGPPGTGKTHYIRSLIPRLVRMGKRVILIPKHVLTNLESPQFNTFMIENFADERIVFIIEDAESIITKRDGVNGHRSELVSTILNITDGILNDIFNVQVILTFNTELSSIDDALLRKGRLISKYEFSNLTREDAVKLANYLGTNIKGNSKTYSLAEIYAMQEVEDDDILINQNIAKSKTFVGF